MPSLKKSLNLGQYKIDRYGRYIGRLKYILEMKGLNDKIEIFCHGHRLQLIRKGLR